MFLCKLYLYFYVVLHINSAILLSKRGLEEFREAKIDTLLLSLKVDVNSDS